GGADGKPAAAWLETPGGTRHKLPNTGAMVLHPGETIHGFDASGGGDGSPFGGGPRLRLGNILGGWEAAGHSPETYAVEFVTTADGLAVDEEATALRRASAATSAGDKTWLNQ